MQFGKIMSDNDLKRIIGSIKDPDLNKSFDELNAVKSLNINGDNLAIRLSLPGPILWIKEDIERIIKAELVKLSLDYNLDINIDENPIDNSKRQVLKKVKHIIAVASGKGGVGKSSIAANMAAALSEKGAKVGILDADVYGPSQPTMFGLSGARLEAKTFSDGTTIAVPVEKNGIKVASMGFVLNRDEAAIVRGPMLASYFSLLFEQIEWGELDFLVFDLPPGTGDIQLTLTQKIPLSGAVVVTTPQEIALADVRRSVAMFRRVNVDILGIVENMSYFVPPDMPDKKYYIFGKDGGKQIALESGAPLLAQIPLNIDMREGNDGGEPIVISGKAPEQKELIKDAAAAMIGELRRKTFNALDNKLEIEL